MAESLFPEQIETERLRLEAITEESVDPLELYEYFSDDAPNIEETTRWVTWSGHDTPKETAELIEGMARKRRDGEGSTYVIYPKEGEDGAGEFAGTCGIGVDWDRKVAEPGIWLRKPFWGRGYSPERAGALIELAFERLDLELVAVGASPENEQSLRAIEKYVEAHGGQREGLFRRERVDQDGNPMDLVRFSISREEYEATTE